MAPRKFESDTFSTKANNAKQPGSRTNVLNATPWLQNPSIPVEQKKISPPCSYQLCGLIAFLLLSILTFSLASIHPAPSEQLRTLLGQAPPELYLNIACAVYIVSEVFYIILRGAQNGSRQYSVKQLMFFSGFFLFFWYAEMLQAHFVLLTVSGIILQVMESFRRAQSCKATKADA